MMLNAMVHTTTASEPRQPSSGDNPSVLGAQSAVEQHSNQVRQLTPRMMRINCSAMNYQRKGPSTALKSNISGCVGASKHHMCDHNIRLTWIKQPLSCLVECRDGGW